jgi:single-strand selective monofunctional uracil DNA glycosylase
MTPTARAVAAAAHDLADALERTSCEPPVSHVYHPLRYAAAMHDAYIETYATGPKRTLFLGMNPGPFGMAQTGIPFGEVGAVRDWLKLSGAIVPPAVEHPRRPIEGMACPRSEVSGKRLWGLFARRFGTAPAFFAEHFVVNWCPLLFLEEDGKNRTPDQLPVAEREAIGAACDEHLRRVVTALKPQILVGVGRFASDRAAEALTGANVPKIVTIAHPSPANPAANKGWDALAERELVAGGVWAAAARG